ncbi:type VI secretion system baseplate subunit TssK [Rhodovulum tesquicola]|uniref:type VI secretion system baseplate subunit TssK n=1 Tax=Rhodovulum tesquicola TaxID=540254 RepID=UPI002096DD47|nr:type VI secretion system baseplate subunit TssK [Rhodovulum tesquicola]MCO8144964.1 type VI secretion system baseplate subunit TssK [Rhodovulum tesquicola]
MGEGNRVVWSEGLFLRTQHFQQQDRWTEALVRGALGAARHQSWGFGRLVLDRAALGAGRVGIETAQGILPDGTPFSLPETMPAPEPVAIAADTPAGLVRIAVPLERSGAATIEPHHADPAGARYRGALVEIRDTVLNGAEPEEIEIAHLQPRLLLPGQDETGFATLPICRIDGLKADGAVALDEGHLPPALITAAAPWYARFAHEIATGLERITEAHGKLLMGGSGASVENLLILELANTARPRIAHMLAQDLFHPSEFFLELAGLAGRMATFGSNSRSLSALPAYDHMDPQRAFEALADTLRSLILSLRHVEIRARPLEVRKHSRNVWTVRLGNPELVNSSRIVVRVGSDMSDEKLRQIFVNQTTVGAADEFDTLWKSRLPGIPLKPLHSQPREIPYDGDRLCLELDRHSDHWAQLADAAGFVIGVSGELASEPEIDCYAVSR